MTEESGASLPAIYINMGPVSSTSHEKQTTSSRKVGGLESTGDPLYASVEFLGRRIRPRMEKEVSHGTYFTPSNFLPNK